MGKSNRANGALAGLLAAAADLGADAAMFMMLSVPVAFIRAQAAGKGAGFEHRAEELFVGTGPPGRSRSGSEADVGAIQIEPNALAQRRDIALDQASVGAGHAGLRAVITFVDAAYQCVIGLTLYIGVRGDDLPGMHRFSPRLSSADNIRGRILFLVDREPYASAAVRMAG
jgi:hypothetical protein